MDTREFAERFLLNMPFDPTGQQTSLMAALSRYCTIADREGTVFLLNGYAGTGKTSVVGALVRTLRETGVPVVLLAPTGRAAKVFSAAAGVPAWTIHRRIYSMSGPALAGGTPSLTVNRRPSTVFIVDEASMIGDNESEYAGSLLHDLLTHVMAGAPGCRLILMGDTAQLPPVGCETSPAMDPGVLRRLGMRVSRAVITQTVRQRHGSVILTNATRLRRIITSPPPADGGSWPRPSLSLGGDVEAIPGNELLDAIASAYAAGGVDSTILITRSNLMATAANRAIRAGVMYSEEELVRGERLMIAKNNYLWSEGVRELDFIANGDIATVTAIKSTEILHGFRFADVTLAFPDRGAEVDCKILLDTLTSDSVALDPGRHATLVSERLRATGSTSLRALRRDPWAQALQVKYAYAVTCHKAQGGQWRNVFVDSSGLLSAPEGTSPVELYRWFYTAFTRATRRLVLVNAPEEAFSATR